MSATKISSWIHVTGAPRSGTTFVGSILSAPLSVDYIHEPFNPDCGLPSIDRPYLYLRDDDLRLPAYSPDIEALFDYSATLRTGMYARDSRGKRIIKKIVGSRGPFHYRLAKLNPFHDAAVLKDPVGCLLTSFLQRKYSTRPVVIVRHPVTFVASVMRLGWRMSPHAILDQPALLEDYLPEEDASAALVEAGPLLAAAHVWRLLNTVLQRQATANQGWLIIRQEDLSEDPLLEFRQLFEALALPWSGRIERKIKRWTATNNAAEADSGRVQQFRRDSRKIHDLRIGMLDVAERRQVFDITGQVASKWYDEHSFQI